MPSIGGLTWLILFQIFGTIISDVMIPLIPGPILGLIFLFAYLLYRREVPKPIEVAAGSLLRYLPMLLVPPAVGIMRHFDILYVLSGPLLIVLVGSLVASLIVCGWVMQLSIKFFEKRKGQNHDR